MLNWNCWLMNDKEFFEVLQKLQVLLPIDFEYESFINDTISRYSPYAYCELSLKLPILFLNKIFVKFHKTHLEILFDNSDYQLLKGDMILKINGEIIGPWVRNTREFGNKVILEVLKFRLTDIMNDKFEVSLPSFDLLNNNIKKDGNTIVCQIIDFNQKLETILKKEMMEKEYEMLIIDLTNNTGGELLVMKNFLSLFFNYGTYLFTLNNRNGSRFPIFQDIKEEYLYQGDIKIIINQYTMSSAEIFKDVLEKKRGAQIVGGNSYGKSVVQKRIEINDVTYFLPIMDVEI